MLQVIKNLSALGRWRKLVLVMSYDAVAMFAALWAGFAIRLDTLYWPIDAQVLFIATLAVIGGLLGLHALGVYRIVIRYLDHRTVVKLLAGAGLAAIVWFSLAYLSGVRFLPRSVGLIYWAILFGLLLIGRQAMAMLILQVQQMPAPLIGRGTQRRNVAVFGANEAGIALVHSLRGNPHYRAVALIDDKPGLAGRTIASLRVHETSRLQAIIDKHGIEEIFMAMPEATRAERVAAIELLSEHPVVVKTIPSPAELATGRFSVSDIRPIEVNDLLSRDPVPPKPELVSEAVAGASILVTGGGGSIGSEICRQVVHHKPRKLVILDHSEFALFAIQSELLELTGKLDEGERPEIAAAIGSLLQPDVLAEVIAAHDIDTVFHAAAYKHVPLLEDNEVVGVENNVIGTRNVAMAAVNAGVKRFTMISTDKAVRPKSVMGASKRAAELFIQALADHGDHETRFGIVRFGNVLDSSGSVVQRFREQIKSGGPVTVTHKDITRFFMSIPEATQLVLQASAMAKGGEVFVLDMGEPVRIYDLAVSMIHLSGMTTRDSNNPSGDIEVVISGLRPGEKLYEELFVGDEIETTFHPRINMSRERFAGFSEIESRLGELSAAIAGRDRRQLRKVLSVLTAYDENVEVAAE